jgi:glycosyltransferase involved in cell wall biosynthesis
MEAMSCGIPVVAFNVGGIPDMVDDGINGLLTQLKSSEKLAESIELILSDEELRKKFSLAARKKVIKNFDQNIIAEKYFKVYKSLV